MREIKFRAWDKDRQKITGGCCNLMLQMNGLLMWQFGFNPPEPLNEPDNFILMQYTNLKDKNGVEIYEGDVVKVLDRDCPSQLDSYPEMSMEQYIDHISTLCEVEYRGDGFVLKYISGGGYYSICLAKSEGRDRFEVIGNIYENPELEEPK